MHKTGREGNKKALMQRKENKVSYYIKPDSSFIVTVFLNKTLGKSRHVVPSVALVDDRVDDLRNSSKEDHCYSKDLSSGLKYMVFMR